MLENKRSFDTLNNISGYFTFVQFLDTVGDGSYSVSVSGTWIFDYNVKKITTIVKIINEYDFYSSNEMWYICWFQKVVLSKRKIPKFLFSMIWLI